MNKITYIKAWTEVRRIKTYHAIYGTPTSGTYADYLLLKKCYSRQDKAPWRYGVAFNIKFLRTYKQKYGELTCSFCGEKHLIIQSTTGPKVPENRMATVDHFTPKSKGGAEFDTDNFVVSCGKCNRKKDSKIFGFETLRFIPEERLNILKIFSEKVV